MSPQKKGPFQKEMSSSNHQFSGGYLSFLGEYIYLFISEPKTYESSTNFVCKKIRLCCRVNFTPEKKTSHLFGHFTYEDPGITRNGDCRHVADSRTFSESVCLQFTGRRFKSDVSSRGLPKMVVIGSLDHPRTCRW